jgi:carbamoyltransferase
MRTDMDYLCMGGFLLDKREQKPLENDTDWQNEFEPD